VGHITFQSHKKGELSGRSGTLKIGKKTLHTPKFFPILNIITGPPGIFRSGGNWKGIKNGLLKEVKIDAFMCQILHFLDYNISKKCLDRWFEESMEQRFQEEAGYSPIIFADSGGFKLLSSEGIDTSKIGIEATPKNILDLQIRFDAHILATLDYPIHPDLPLSQINDRKQKSIGNAIETLKIASEKDYLKDRMIYIPVHGYNFASSYSYVTDTLDQIIKNDFIDVNFGLAIGSLVPINSSYKKMIDIVAGVIKSIQDYDNVLVDKIPIHAFGVSGMMMPIFAMMGVDSFDSSGFAVAANNLFYLTNFGYTGKRIYDLKEKDIECNCTFCEHFKNGNLESIKKIMKDKPYQEYSLNGEKILKYHIYSWLACHNYLITEDMIQKTRHGIENGNFLLELLDLYKNDQRIISILTHLSKYYENLSDNLLEYNRLLLTEKQITIDTINWKETEKIADISNKNIFISNKIKSLDYTPDDYSILKSSYNPSQKDILLLTSCSKQKPYSESNSIKSLIMLIQPWEKNIELIVLSGMYGPIPIIHEHKQPIIEYDYFLSSTNTKRIDLLTDRTLEFLEKYKNNFNQIIAYATSKPYRILIDNINREHKEIEIFPKDLSIRKGIEFTKKKNLIQLKDYLEKYFESE